MTCTNEGMGNIVGVLTYIDLADCRILVTTRPHLENNFNQGELPKVYAKMEIEGFSHENSRQYIDKFFRGDTAQGQKLKEYLDQNDVIGRIGVNTTFLFNGLLSLERESSCRDRYSNKAA